jgi:subtilisin family serine protease
VLHAGKAAASATTTLAVTYNRSVMTASNVRLIAGRESAASATLVQTFDYPRLNTTQRIITVPTATLAQSQALLSEQSGVQSIAVSGGRRYRMTASSAPSNDPYFMGFTGTTAPYHEASAIPGEWDLYAIGLDKAFGYASASTNTTGTANPLALGSSTIKIAIIDTGEDTHHPELSGKIAYQKCFITNAAGTSQSTGNFTSDEDGHGTDVSGIAAAATNNSFGFAGVGGNAVIYGYRVFPTPDANCSNENTTDSQCSSDTTDIAAAINDAVAQHVNVISMSLGGDNCTSGGADSDPTEGAAVAAAIAANVIVVAAAGNGGTSGVSAPGCDPGVIAVGATGLDDGTATGTSPYTTSNTTGASATNPVEYVASYSQYGTANSLRSSSSWGIVAPGGDPSNADTSGSTTDDLHWIEQIWTTTPFGGQSDANFAGQCATDYPADSPSGNLDCRTLIAGTSMATPHVAGAAALLLAVNPSLQSPTAMKAFLCQYADDLGDSHQGCGRLNIYRAMAHAVNDPNPPT